MILDEFPGEIVDGLPKKSLFCDVDWNCTADSSLTTQCFQGTYQFKVPIQELSDFWYNMPYGGPTHLKIEYTSVVSENIISLTFNNYSTPPLFYSPSRLQESIWAVGTRQSATEFDNISYYAKDIRIGHWIYGSRLNNPRNIGQPYIYSSPGVPYSNPSLAPYDYSYWTVDVNNYPITGEVKISLNNSCTGGTWNRGVTNEDEVLNYARHYYNMTIPLSLPTDGSIQEVSIQARDLVTGQYSECVVKRFAYSPCPYGQSICDSNGYTVDYPNSFIY